MTCHFCYELVKTHYSHDWIAGFLFLITLGKLHSKNCMSSSKLCHERNRKLLQAMSLYHFQRALSNMTIDFNAVKTSDSVIVLVVE
ncbi:CLUMA_CG012854, isoform A [Clunio marinus]|uniref:CLUMA_CG012854, isoform A n=1 Tax=Clunio marinus TaxID=568069 RepID=A0A1J1IGZ4_9DIPT|nr:CLUMA_CG012854, isoform A [Clunio marinus]